MKKLSLCLLSVSILAACSSKPEKVKEVYKIADKDVIAYITESNNIEKCLPKGVRLKSLTDEERRVLNGTKLDSLTSIIGDKANSVWYDAELYGGDKEANEYFENKLIELAHKKTDVTPSECSEIRNKFAQRLSKYIAKVNYANSPQGQFIRQQQSAAFFNMIQGMGAQIMQQPKQLDYLQQLEIEKARAQQNQRRVNTQTNCNRIGNQVYCNSTSY